MTTESAPKVWIVGSGRLYLRIPLMQRLRAWGFQMGAVGQDAHPEFEGTGFPYFQYPLRRSLNPLADRRALTHLVHLFREHRPQLVHAVNTKPAILAPAAARQAGGAVYICTITGLGAVFSSSSVLARTLRPMYRHLLRRSCNTSSATVFQNPDDRDYFLRHRMVKPGRDALVLSSGIDVEEYRQRRSDDATLDALRRSLKAQGKQVVIMAARLIRPKGVVEYLKAAAAVRQRRPGTVFLLIGTAVTEGPLALPLERIHQSAADVQYLGNRSDVHDLLSISDLCVLPSYFREGVPRIMIEAGAMGLPLVTTDCPGCRETVKDGWNGLLVPPGDWRTLADSILQLLGSADLRATMGRRSQAYVRERFELDTVATAYADIYRKALGIEFPQPAEWRRAA